MSVFGAHTFSLPPMTQTQANSAFLLPASDNKRLDEWVVEDRLDLRRIQFPRKDKDAPTTTTQCTTTGLNTPKKVTPMLLMS